MAFTEHGRLGETDIGGPPRPISAKAASLDHPALERHYRISELAEMWNLGRETLPLW